MKKTRCPACKNSVQLPTKIRVQDFITCPDCHTQLEVVRLFPATLKWVEDPVALSSHKKPIKF